MHFQKGSFQNQTEYAPNVGGNHNCCIVKAAIWIYTSFMYVLICTVTSLLTEGLRTFKGIKRCLQQIILFAAYASGTWNYDLR